jgi:hypothetical protein
MVTDGTKPIEDAKLPEVVKETPKTITLEEHEKGVRDARSAALAEVGRLKKSSEEAVKQAQAAQSRINKLMEDQDKYELEIANGNPEQLSAVQERQKRRRIESELETERQTKLNLEQRLKDIEETQTQTQREQIVTKISTQYNVSADKLSKLAKFTDGTPEAIEDIAKDLPKKQESNLKVDSNTTIGGVTQWEKQREAYIKNPRSPEGQEWLKVRDKHR